MAVKIVKGKRVRKINSKLFKNATSAKYASSDLKHDKEKDNWIHGNGYDNRSQRDLSLDNDLD